MVDCDLAIGLCTLLSKAEVYKILWKVIDNTWQNYDKILVGNMITVLMYLCSYVLNCFIVVLIREMKEKDPGKGVNTGTRHMETAL